MVQLKYFGDSRDYFKYDLITSLIKEMSSFRKYVFVPMLTEDRADNEGNKIPRNSGGKSDELLSFVEGCQNKSLRHWKTWLAHYVDSYHTIEPVDGIYFCDARRSEYWKRFKDLLVLETALVFVDPDTGLETGKPSYLRNKRERYILNTELKDLISNLASTSVLMVYQHLQRNRHKHIEDINKKLKQVSDSYVSAFACAYREDDLAFIFVSKKEVVHKEVFSALNKYHSRSTNKYKSIPSELLP